MNLNWKVEVVLEKMNFNIEELKDAIMDTFDKNFIFGDDAQFDTETLRCIKHEIMNAETLTDIFDAMKISSNQLGNDPFTRRKFIERRSVLNLRHYPGLLIFALHSIA